MRISNCKGCGRIFNVLSDEQYCPNCQKKMDEKFDIVKRGKARVRRGNQTP